ncbi:hypothetical protein GHK45_02905 [Sinorhizobium meliloti]|uniref:Uncharacterized protein n=1 Tax=Rhizobium meliloti TaxID=382 RepID=A0A6A7ZIX1_RHIML|nr:hypothetical protein [Sinorhizobium meliloti]MQW02810.1 hypothetical protein [Sinorhizobium meliloti]
MALKQGRISIEVFEPSTGPETIRNEAGRADPAILALARLIGRQIAREQFESASARERKAQRQKQNRESP